MISKKIILTTTVLAAAVGFAANPIGWWSMDELDANGHIPDLSGNGRALELYGDVVLTNCAVSGKALYNPADVRDSSVRFTCPGGLRERSISMWLRLENQDGTYTYDNGNNSYPHVFNAFGGMRLLYSFDSTARGLTLYAGSTPCEDKKWLKPRGIWSHFVVTLGEISANDETAALKVYQDGVPIMEQTVTLAGDWSTANSHTCSIAGNGNNRPIHGFIDEVKIFDVALTPAEVSAEFKAHANPESVVAHWTMEHTEIIGGKTYVMDETGRNPLELKGGASITTDDPVVGSAALQISGIGDSAQCSSPSNTAQSLTFAAWLWMSGTEPIGNSYPRVADFGSGTFFNVSPNVDNLNLTVQCFGSGDSVAGANTLAAKGYWSHIVVTIDVGCDNTGWWQVTKWYRNGELCKTGAKKYRADGESNFGGLRSSLGFNIGNNGGYNRPFVGKMDDIWIFNRPLEDAEVRELYRRAAKVAAGDDFSVAGETAMLRGMMNPASGSVFVQSGFGKVKWTQVSGTEAVILSPDSIETAVTLPEEGAYTFRLTSENAFGDAETDEVTVTRLASPAAAPTVTASVEESAVVQPAPAYLSASVSGAERIAWSKKSGPGGVYFDDPSATKAQAFFTCPGVYVLTCMAENGGASAASDVTVDVTGAGSSSVSTNGLACYWNFDEAPIEAYSKTFGSSVNNYWLKPSRVGFGIGDIYQEGDHGAYFNANLKTPCADNLTLAYWMYHDDPVDATKIGTVQYSRVFSSTLVTVQYNNTAAKPTFIIYMANVAGKGGWKFTSAALDGAALRNGNVKGRWSHVAIVMNFSDYTGAEMPPADRVKFYIDGEAIACSKIEVDGTPKDGDDYIIRRRTENGANSGIGGISTNNRYFPGVLDEIRYYTRALSQAEVQRLAFDFSPMNRAPIVEVPQSLTVARFKTVELCGVVFDDGIGMVSSRWEVVSGPAQSVVLGNSESAQTTVKFTQAGQYALRLVASDGEQTTYSGPVAVTVEQCGIVISIR